MILARVGQEGLRVAQVAGARRRVAHVADRVAARKTLELVGVLHVGFEGATLLPLIEASERGPDRPSFAALGAPIMLGGQEQNSTTDGAVLRAVEEIDRLSCAQGLSVRMRVRE